MKLSIASSAVGLFLVIIRFNRGTAIGPGDRWRGCILPEPPLYGGYTRVAPRHLQYWCHSGFVLLGTDFNNKIKCKRGRWDGQAYCHLNRRQSDRCPELPVPMNGDKVQTGTNEPDDTVSFYCNIGYVLVGSSTRTCQSNRRWTGQQPVCESRKTVRDLANALSEHFLDKHAVASGTSGHRNSRLSPGLRGLDLVFLLDVSASIDLKSLEIGRNFIKTIVRVFGVSEDRSGGQDGTRVALLTFNEQTKIIFNLNDRNIRSIEKVNAEIDRITDTSGGTDLAGALAYAFSETFVKAIRPVSERYQSANRAVFIITDAVETHIGKDKERTKERADMLKQYKFEIYTIGVGRAIDWALLAQIASPPSAHHIFNVEDFKDLDEIGDIISEKKMDYVGCGISGNTFLDDISGPSHKAAWPWLGWMNIITENFPRNCGGALLCRRWFITAAHCVYDADQQEAINVTNVNVHLGDHSLYEDDQMEMLLSPKRILIHPLYNTSEPALDGGVRPYDVALLDFGEEEEGLPPLNKYNRPICVPSNESTPLFDASVTDLRVQKTYEWPREAGTVAGWGMTPKLMTQLPAQLPFEILRQVKRTINNDIMCKRVFPSLDTNKFFCVQSFPELDDCRAGDIGGPYMSLLHHKWVSMLGLALKTDNCDKGDEKAEHTSIYLNTLDPSIVSWLGENLKGCNAIKECKIKDNIDDTEAPNKCANLFQ